MTVIHLTSFVKAPIERVFDLSRSIDLHKIACRDTEETAIAGTCSGLIGIEETVTWEAKHIFKKRQFTAQITALESPIFFEDKMLRGDFKSFRHEHHFKSVKNGCLIIDQIYFESPYGILGKIFNRFFLKKYMEKLLLKRNLVIKEYAESAKWQFVLR